MNNGFQYHFHGVGQGLFASGCLYQANSPQPRFLWVYDCGSSSAGKPWQAEIQKLTKFAACKRSIDLLTISHFDEDHILGVIDLLREFKVEALLLPYMPLWKRLSIAFASGVTGNDPFLNFYLNPVGYLRSVAGAEIERIIIIAPDDGNSADLNGPPPYDLPPANGPWQISARTKPPTQRPTDNNDPFENATDAEVLPPGETISIHGLWEFVPYNAPHAAVPSSFSSEVRKQRDLLTTESSPEVHENALKSLKSLFNGHFGRGDKARNAISLFLYSGPIYSSWAACKMISRRRKTSVVFPVRYPCYYRVNPDAPGLPTKCSILYSGDGYLDRPPKFDDLNRSLGEIRMRRLGVFQVNHHGAKANWHPGLAEKLCPRFSIFCSDDTKGNCHPSKEVKMDFQDYRPIQVNKSGCSFYGWLLR